MFFKFLLYAFILYIAVRVYRFFTSEPSQKSGNVKSNNNKRRKNNIPIEDIIEAKFEDIKAKPESKK